MQSLSIRFPGLVLTAGLALCALSLAGFEVFSRHGLGVLTLAILLGASVGNLWPGIAQGAALPGLKLAQTQCLRAGVALYGFNLSLQQIAQLGTSGVGIDALMVCSTLGLGWLVGRHVLGMDRTSTLLTAAGSAICGAAAVVATLPVLESRDRNSADKAAAAVATVVLFGTLAMLVYPALYAWLGGSRTDFGIFVGSTVHEVAQVVAIGSGLGDEAAHGAVIAKMIRVMLLVPFLLVASALWRRGEEEKAPITVPWFALMFVAFAAFNSTGILPEAVTALLRQTGQILLAIAMVALGLNITFAQMRSAGLKPFLLGLILFAHLLCSGWWINRWLI